MKRSVLAVVALLASGAVALRALTRPPRKAPGSDVAVFLPEAPLATRTMRTRPGTLHVLVLNGRAVDRRAHEVSARLLVRTADSAQNIGMLTEGRNALGAVVSVPRASPGRGVGLEVSVQVGDEWLTAGRVISGDEPQGDAWVDPARRPPPRSVRERAGAPRER